MLSKIVRAHVFQWWHCFWQVVRHWSLDHCMITLWQTSHKKLYCTCGRFFGSYRRKQR